MMKVSCGDVGVRHNAALQARLPRMLPKARVPAQVVLKIPIRFQISDLGTGFYIGRGTELMTEF